MNNTLFLTLKEKNELYLAYLLCDELKNKNLKQLERLLKSKKANPNLLMLVHGITPFHLVIHNNSETFAEHVTKLFLQYGGNPNVKSADDLTPVHVAAAWGRSKVLELLLIRGGDPFCIDSDNYTPFYYALKGEHYEALSILSKYCTNTEEKNEKPKFKLELGIEYVISDCQLLGCSSKVFPLCNSNIESCKYNTNGYSHANKIVDVFSINNDFVTIKNKQIRKNAKKKVTSEIEIIDRASTNERKHIKEYKIKSLKEKQITMNFNELSKSNKYFKLFENYYTNKKNSSILEIKQHNYLSDLNKKILINNFNELHFILNNDISSNISLKYLKTNIPTKFKVKIKLRNDKSNSNIWFNEPIISKSPNLFINYNLYRRKKNLLKNSNIEKKLSLQTIYAQELSAITSSKSKYQRLKRDNNVYYPVNKILNSKKYATNKYSHLICNKRSKEIFPKIIIDIKYKHDLEKKICTIEKTQNENSLKRIFNIYKISSSSISQNNNLQGIQNKKKNFKYNMKKLNYSINNVGKKNKTKEYTLSRKSIDEYFPTLKKKFIKLNSESGLISDIEIHDLCTTSKSNLKLVKTEKRSPREMDIDFNEVFFNSNLSVEWKRNNSNKKNKKSNILMYTQNSISAEAHDDFLSLVKIDKTDTYNDAQSIKEIDLKLLFSNYKHLSINNHSLHKNLISDEFVDMDECKYKDCEDVILQEKRLCVSHCGASSDTKTSFYSCHSTKSESLPKEIFLDNITLRKKLKILGENPGPITSTTYHLYLKQLHKLESQNRIKLIGQNSDLNISSKCFNNFEKEKKKLKSSQLSTEWIKNLEDFEIIEQKVFFEFAHPDPSRKWREGNCKNSFNYLLLDPRITKDLPRRANKLNLSEKWETFLTSIFYIGKGKQSRPYAHLYDAFKLWISHDVQNINNIKIKRILNIWNEGKGVVVLNVFFNTIPVEAYTREAAMIEMLGLQKLGNCKYGNYYGTMATWRKKEKYELGRYLLFKALQILLLEGERQIFPDNL